MNKLKTAWLLLCLIIGLQAKGQTHRVITSVSSEVTYGVIKYDSIYSIVVNIYSNDLRLHTEPVMKIRTFADDYLNLKGVLISSNTGINGERESTRHIYSMALFVLTPEQFERLREGIKKIRLSTLPTTHERTFRRDELGKPLYELYLKEKRRDESF